MEEISESTYFNWLNSAFRSDPEKRNHLYFSILDQIKQSNPQDAARNIVLLIDQEMEEIKSNLAEKTLGGQLGNSSKPNKGSFRRV